MILFYFFGGGWNLGLRDCGAAHSLGSWDIIKTRAKEKKKIIWVLFLTYLFILVPLKKSVLDLSFLFPSLYKKYIPNGVLKGTVSVLQNQCIIKIRLGFLNEWL